MSIHPIDLTIIGTYLIAVVVVGVVLSRRASADMDSYFLGGKKVPWYMLGVSNASSMFDITGTMWLVLMFFVYGVKGGWIPWLWPLFNQIFLAVYLSRWIRRSNVLTGAEWITTRFGETKGAELSRIAVLAFALVSVVGFLAYAFQGIGKFASVFFPFGLTPETYAIIVMGITTVYVVAGGMYSVVFTDVVQFVLLTIVSFAIGIIAFNAVAPEALYAVVPDGWGDLSFGWTLDLDWSGLMPAVNSQIESDGWGLFTIFMMMCLFKGFLVSAAGPAPNYDMQRVLATRTPKEAGFMSAIVTLCITPRYFMVVGITTLGLVYFGDELMAMGDSIDFELVLPLVVSEFLPVGIVGLLLAGLLAAFMSTFDSTVNAGAAYLVNDLYSRYIKRGMEARHYVRASYVASLVVVAVGIVFGFMSESINSVTQWIVSGLFGGYTAPNVLKWHWWRFNGVGYFCGMMAGMVAALLFPVFATDLSALEAFPFVLLASAVASVVASLLTQPDDEATLKTFYRTVRPWGFWAPIVEKLRAEDPSFAKNASFGKDMLNVGLGIVWQNCFYFLPVLLMVYDYTGFAIAVFGAGVTTVILKKTWYDRLGEEDHVDAAVAAA